MKSGLLNAPAPATQKQSPALKPHLRSMARYMCTIPNLMDYVRIIIYFFAVEFIRLIHRYRLHLWRVPIHVRVASVLALQAQFAPLRGKGGFGPSTLLLVDHTHLEGRLIARNKARNGDRAARHLNYYFNANKAITMFSTLFVLNRTTFIHH